MSAQPYDDRHQQEARRPLQPVRQQTTPQLPRVTLDKFSGSALEWPRWIALFRALVHDRDDLTDVERLTYLQAHLTGPAKESVRGMLCDSSLYGEAMRELEEEFGDPARVIHATMKKLLDSRPVKDGDMSAVTELSRDLRTAVRVLQCLHYDADISAATNVTAVISKLPAALALKWGEHSVHNGLVRPTLPDLDSWLRGYVAAGRASLTLTGHQQSKAEVNSGESRQRRVYATALAPAAPREVVKQKISAIKAAPVASEDACVFCQGTHVVERCDRFLQLTASERAEVAGCNGLCFNCLARGHISAACPSGTNCGHENCGKRHHTLLHNGGRVFPRRSAAGSAPSPVKHVGTAVVEPPCKVLLQTLPITVHGPAGRCTTHALLDLGSQVTLVTEGLSDRLGISGPIDSSVLSTINGSERLRSRRVSFVIEPVSSGGTRHEIRNAQTTPTLSVSNHAMDWSREKGKWPHLADLDLPSATRGPVEVLLGADVIELIVAREVIDGPPGAPCAVRTLLGWTVTGRAPYQNLPVNKDVHHIRVSEETQDASEVTRWQNVPGSLNSSNIGSRGCSVAEVAPGEEWGQGRAVLSRRPQDRPAAPPRPTERPRDEETAEMRAPACVIRGAEPAINPSRFSSWLRLLRVTAWVRRFAYNSRSRAAADRRTGPLTAEELREAERVWLLSTQAEHFGDDIAALQHGRRLPPNSQLHRLNPFLDSSGLLRVGGQLRHAQLDFKVKHRVILPARGDITRLIVTDRHKKLSHSGAEHVLTHLRHQFWVISGTAAAERYTPACMPCRKRSAQPAPTPTSDLQPSKWASRPRAAPPDAHHTGEVTRRPGRRAARRISAGDKGQPASRALAIGASGDRVPWRRQPSAGGQSVSGHRHWSEIRNRRSVSGLCRLERDGDGQ